MTSGVEIVKGFPGESGYIVFILEPATSARRRVPGGYDEKYLKRIDSLDEALEFVRSVFAPQEHA